MMAASFAFVLRTSTQEEVSISLITRASAVNAVKFYTTASVKLESL